MKRLVIIGGGFAGSHLAKRLQNTFATTLIDTKNYFEFTPGILRTLVQPQHRKSIEINHATYLKYTHLIIGHVKVITKTTVEVNNKHIAYDYLVICSGSHYATPFKEQDVIVATRAKHLVEHCNKLTKATSVLIIGGGLVSAELAGEICTAYPKKHVTVVHAHKNLIERNPPRARKAAHAFLTNHGVTIHFNERVKSTKHGFITDKGRSLTADISFLCIGIRPNSEFLKPHFSNYLTNKQFLKVTPHLHVPDHPTIFAAGDITDQSEEKTAQNALRQAKVVATNILAADKGTPLTPYEPRTGPLVISLGKRKAILVIGRYSFFGVIPALMKTLIEKWEMLRKRL